MTRLSSASSVPARRPAAAAGHPRDARLAALLVLSGLLIGAVPAQALKIATWNLVVYPNSILASRQPNLRTAIAAMDPDVIALQELKSAAGRDSFLNNVLNVAQPGQWAATPFFLSCESAVFYKPARVVMVFSGSPISTGGPRDVLGVLIRPVGYSAKSAQIRLYSIHFKAGTDYVAERESECASLRTTLNAATSAVTPNFLILGDTNFYGDDEGGYLRLTESQSDNDGRTFDTLNLPGTWNQSGYSSYHTQSTCSSGCPTDWSTGGLDDRFDLILHSASLADGEGLDQVPGGYVAYGNDGLHYNSSVNAGGYNYAVGMTVANALYWCSDHLPVVATLQVPARVSAASQLAFGRVIVGATAEQTLTVADGAVAPADELDYSFTAPGGFSAPAGSFTAATGAAGNAHTISMSTAAVGAASGTLTVACDDPDSTAKAVQLSGTVLAHASASLDSLVVTTGMGLDFGTLAGDSTVDLPVRVHNANWTSLQARLEVTGGEISGGDGHFSIVGGFAAAELAGVGHTYDVRFDAAGATADSTYEATLVLSGSDEALPGSAAASDLTVTLSARTAAADTGVPPGLPERIAFLPPSPNPFHGSTLLRFDLPADANVSLELFDLSGRRVATLVQGPQSAGRHMVRWSPAVGGQGLQAGLYFASFRSGGYGQTRRIVLVP